MTRFYAQLPRTTVLAMTAAALVVLVAARLLHRSSAALPLAVPPTSLQPSVELHHSTLPSGEQPADVLVWLESTPPKAAIVRVADGFVLGWTPETISFRRSTEPVLIRFEKAGFDPVTRKVPVDADGQLSVLLSAKRNDTAQHSRN
jgi:hypothetical protein